MKYAAIIAKNLPEGILCLIVLGFTFVIGAAVFSRYVFFFAISWAEEITRFLQIWGAFIGGAVGVKHLSHVRLLLVHDKMPLPIQGALDLLAHLSFVILGCILLVYGGMMVALTMNQYTPALAIPQGLVYLALPIGGSLMILYSLLHIYRQVISRREVGSSKSENK